MNKLIIGAIVGAIILVIIVIAAVVMSSKDATVVPVQSSGQMPITPQRNIVIVAPKIRACTFSGHEVEYVANGSCSTSNVAGREFDADFNVFSAAGDKPNGAVGLFEIVSASGTPRTYFVGPTSLGRLIGYVYPMSAAPARGPVVPLYINTAAMRVANNATVTSTFLSTRSEAEASKWGWTRGAPIALVPSSLDGSLYL